MEERRREERVEKKVRKIEKKRSAGEKRNVAARYAANGSTMEDIISAAA